MSFELTSRKKNGHGMHLQDLYDDWRHISDLVDRMHYVISIFSPLAPINCLHGGNLSMIVIFLVFWSFFFPHSIGKCFSICFGHFDNNDYQNRAMLYEVDSCN